MGGAGPISIDRLLARKQGLVRLPGDRVKGTTALWVNSARHCSTDAFASIVIPCRSLPLGEALPGLTPLCTGIFRALGRTRPTALRRVASSRAKVPDCLVRYLFRSLSAERSGFEPEMPVSRHTGLAIRRFRPLSHLSGVNFGEVSGKPRLRGEYSRKTTQIQGQPIAARATEGAA